MSIISVGKKSILSILDVYFGRYPTRYSIQGVKDETFFRQYLFDKINTMPKKQEKTIHIYNINNSIAL